MVKNTKGGSSHKKMARKNEDNHKELKIDLPSQLDLEETKEIIRTLNEIQNYQHIYFDEANPYLKSDFKKSEDENFEFLENKFLGLEEVLKLLSKQKNELKNLEKQSFLIKTKIMFKSQFKKVYRYTLKFN
jgi:hypothetical protein